MGLTREKAFTDFKLAPLATRRDIGMLGLVHRTVLEKGPPHFQKWFFPARPKHSHKTRLQERAHQHQLFDYVDGDQTELLRRSALGLPHVYNRLPKWVVEKKTVSAFQTALQKLVLQRLRKGDANWDKHLSPRC